MTLHIELRPEIEARLASEAQARGVALETYVVRLVEENLASHPVPSEEHRKAAEELLGFAKKHGARLNGLKLKDLIHEGHNY